MLIFMALGVVCLCVCLGCGTLVFMRVFVLCVGRVCLGLAVDHDEPLRVDRVAQAFGRDHQHLTQPRAGGAAGSAKQKIEEGGQCYNRERKKSKTGEGGLGFECS